MFTNMHLFIYIHSFHQLQTRASFWPSNTNITVNYPF